MSEHFRVRETEAQHRQARSLSASAGRKDMLLPHFPGSYYMHRCKFDKARPATKARGRHGTRDRIKAGNTVSFDNDSEPKIEHGCWRMSLFSNF